jgi:hypothetical protein
MSVSVSARRMVAQRRPPGLLLSACEDFDIFLL